ncbi:MAG: LysM peptidoglycan-binding domain-containing protein [Streptosporangiaceae bacterium]|nr:LysM peptidoglycan-binding domain-containing protein [Streptosporangiaceae bacterium]
MIALEDYRAARRPDRRAAPAEHRASGRAVTATATVPLRLTRRGRVVVAAAAALLVCVLSLLAAVAAQATSRSVAGGAGGQHLTQVTVRQGDSLWSVAERADPDADTRLVVRQIIKLNGLTGDTVLAGQRLWAPRG